MKETFIGTIPENFKKSPDSIYIAVVGTRKAKNFEKFKSKLKEIIKNINTNKNIILVSGGAKGIDLMVEKFAEEFGYNIIVIKPNWKRYKTGAGIRRNTVIVNFSDICIAFVSKESKGTIDTIEKFKKQNKQVIVVEFNE